MIWAKTFINKEWVQYRRWYRRKDWMEYKKQKVKCSFLILLEILRCFSLTASLLRLFYFWCQKILKIKRHSNILLYSHHSRNCCYVIIRTIKNKKHYIFWSRKLNIHLSVTIILQQKLRVYVLSFYVCKLWYIIYLSSCLIHMRWCVYVK